MQKKNEFRSCKWAIISLSGKVLWEKPAWSFDQYFFNAGGTKEKLTREIFIIDTELASARHMQSITAQVLTKNNSFGYDKIQQSVTFSGDLRKVLNNRLMSGFRVLTMKTWITNRSVRSFILELITSSSVRSFLGKNLRFRRSQHQYSKKQAVTTNQL